MHQFVVAAAVSFIGAQAPAPEAAPALSAWYEPMVGDWTYEFASGAGTSSTTYKHGGRVVETVVRGQIGGTPFSGTFLAAVRTDDGNWKGVWADSLGNYLDMTITRANGVLRAEWAMPAGAMGVQTLMRQENSEFTEASYRDQLHVSRDGGETWTTVRDAVFRRAIEVEGL